MQDIPVGVGPHKQPWPTDPKFDPELLEHGDSRNVVDKFRYWTLDAIKAELDKDRTELHVAIENWQHDLNIGTIVRTANAFNVAVVHVIGKRHWNRRGAMVTDRYMTIMHHETVEQFSQWMKKDDREIIAIDIIEGAEPLARADIPKRVVLVFGGEGPGISAEMQHQATRTFMIEQSGSTRSVNVGVAAGIAMYTWTLKHVLTR